MNAFGHLLLLVFLAADDPADLYREGMRLLSAKQPAAAIDAFQQALHLRPGDAATWKALGVAFASGGNYASAEEPFHRACLIDPLLPDACLYFGRTLYLLDRFEPALDVLRRAIEKDPQNPQLHRIAALCLEALGKPADADAAFRRAIGLKYTGAPGDDTAIDYGVFLFRQGRAADALPPLQDAVKRYPKAGRAHLELGCVLLALDRLQESAAHLEQAVILDANSSRAHLLLGKAYQRLGKPELARQHLDQGSRMVK